MTVPFFRITRTLWAAFRPPRRETIGDAPFTEVEPAAIYEWRMGITILQLLIGGVLVFHIIFTAGLTVTGIFSFPGVVYADEIEELNAVLLQRSEQRSRDFAAIEADAKLSQQLVLGLKIDLLNERLCTARTRDLIEAQTAYEELLRGLQADYAAVAHGETYTLLPCVD